MCVFIKYIKLNVKYGSTWWSIWFVESFMKNLVQDFFFDLKFSVLKIVQISVYVLQHC